MYFFITFYIKKHERFWNTEESAETDEETH